MSLRTFILGLSVSFGIAWLAVVVVPYFKMRDLAPITLNEATDGATGVFYPKRSGRVADGALVSPWPPFLGQMPVIVLEHD